MKKITLFFSNNILSIGTVSFLILLLAISTFGDKTLAEMGAILGTLSMIISIIIVCILWVGIFKTALSKAGNRWHGFACMTIIGIFFMFKPILWGGSTFFLFLALIFFFIAIKSKKLTQTMIIN